MGAIRNIVQAVEEMHKESPKGALFVGLGSPDTKRPLALSQRRGNRRPRFRRVQVPIQWQVLSKNPFPVIFYNTAIGSKWWW